MAKELSFEEKMLQKGIQSLSIEEIEKYKKELEAKRNMISYYNTGEVLVTTGCAAIGVGVAVVGAMYNSPFTIGFGAFITVSFTGLLGLMCKEDSKRGKDSRRLGDYISLLNEEKKSKAR